MKEFLEESKKQNEEYQSLLIEMRN